MATKVKKWYIICAVCKVWAWAVWARCVGDRVSLEVACPCLWLG